MKKFLFSWSKSSARSEVSAESFQQTSAYGSLPAGSAPHVGSYPIKPSESGKDAYTHDRTRSFGSQSVTDLLNAARTSKSRSRSVSGIEAGDGYGSKDRKRSSSMAAATMKNPPSEPPPVPKLPGSVTSNNLSGRSPVRHMDLLQAVGYRPITSSGVVPLDRYSQAVAERNTAQSDGSQRSLRTRSPMIYAEDVADRNILRSPELSHSISNFSMTSHELGDDRSTTPSDSMKRRHIHSSAQLFESPSRQREKDRSFVFIQHPVSSTTNSSNSRPFSSQNGSANQPDEQDWNFRLHERSDPNEVAGTQLALPQVAHPTSKPEENQMPQHQPAKPSVSSVGSLRLFPIQGHRRQNTQGGSIGSDISASDQYGQQLAHATPEKADAAKMLRASMVGSNGYIHQPAQASETTLGTYSTAPTSPRSEHSFRDDSVTSINQRAAEAWKQKQSLAMQSRNDTSHSPIVKNSATKDYARPTPEFDMQAEFKRLNEAKENSVPMTQYRSPQELGRGVSQAKGTAARPTTRLYMDSDGTIGQALTADTLVRDFAPQLSPHYFKTPSSPLYTNTHTANSKINGSVTHAEYSDSDQDSAIPPTITRHRDPNAEGRSSRASDHSSRPRDFSSQFRHMLTRDHQSRQSPTRSRRSSASYTLRATIDDERELKARDQGYQIESIDEKRTRSLTLETLARTPLDANGGFRNDTTTPSHSSSDLKPLKETLASIQATIPPPRNRINSIRSDSASGSSYNIPRSGTNTSQSNRHQAPPLRQYYHYNNSPGPSTSSPTPRDALVSTQIQTQNSSPSSSSSRRNSTFSTFSTRSVRSSTSTTLPYHRIPGRRSSLATSQGGGSGKPRADYFGDDALPYNDKSDDPKAKRDSVSAAMQLVFDGHQFEAQAQDSSDADTETDTSDTEVDFHAQTSQYAHQNDDMFRSKGTRKDLAPNNRALWDGDLIRNNTNGSLLERRIHGAMEKV